MFYKIGVLIFFLNSQKTPAPESPFNKVTGLYPATFLKGKTTIQLFLDKVWKNVLWNILPLSNKRALWKMKKSWKQLVRKTTKHAEKKPKHYLHQVFICFYRSKMSFLCFP